MTDWDDRCRRAKAENLLLDVALSGVEHEDARLSYVTVQLDRDLWDQLQEYTGVRGDKQP